MQLSPSESSSPIFKNRRFIRYSPASNGWGLRILGSLSEKFGMSIFRSQVPSVKPLETKCLLFFLTNRILWLARVLSTLGLSYEFYYTRIQVGVPCIKDYLKVCFILTLSDNLNTYLWPFFVFFAGYRPIREIY